MASLGIPLRISIAQLICTNDTPDAEVSIDKVDSNGKRVSICLSPSQSLSDKSAPWSVQRLAEKSNTQFVITYKCPLDRRETQSTITLNNEGYTLDPKTKQCYKTNEKRNYAWLDIYIEGCAKDPLITSRSGISQSSPTKHQTSEDSRSNEFFTKLLSGVLNFLGCQSEKRDLSFKVLPTRNTSPPYSLGGKVETGESEGVAYPIVTKKGETENTPREYSPINIDVLNLR